MLRKVIIVTTSCIENIAEFNSNNILQFLVNFNTTVIYNKLCSKMYYFFISEGGV